MGQVEGAGQPRFKQSVPEDVRSRAELLKLYESALLLPLAPHFPRSEDFNSPELLSSM